MSLITLYTSRSATNYIDPPYLLLDYEEELGGLLPKKHINIAKEITISIRSICRFSIKPSKKQ